MERGHGRRGDKRITPKPRERDLRSDDANIAASEFGHAVDITMG
jgi:hypothetical protein